MVKGPWSQGHKVRVTELGLGPTGMCEYDFTWASAHVWRHISVSVVTRVKSNEFLGRATFELGMRKQSLIPYSVLIMHIKPNLTRAGLQSALRDAYEERLVVMKAELQKERAHSARLRETLRDSQVKRGCGRNAG